MARTGDERSWRRRRGRRCASRITLEVTFPACTRTPETTRLFFPAFHSSDSVQWSGCVRYGCGKAYLQVLQPDRDLKLPMRPWGGVFWLTAIS
jgi:hypothetical protein